MSVGVVEMMSCDVCGNMRQGFRGGPRRGEVSAGLG